MFTIGAAAVPVIAILLAVPVTLVTVPTVGVSQTGAPTPPVDVSTWPLVPAGVIPVVFTAV